MSKNRKAKALAILKNLKLPESQNELLERYKNFDRSYLSTLKDHLQQMKPSMFTIKFLSAGMLLVIIRLTALETFQCGFLFIPCI